MKQIIWILFYASLAYLICIIDLVFSTNSKHPIKVEKVAMSNLNTIHNIKLLNNSSETFIRETRQVRHNRKHKGNGGTRSYKHNFNKHQNRDIGTLPDHNYRNTEPKREYKNRNSKRRPLKVKYNTPDNEDNINYNRKVNLREDTDEIDYDYKSDYDRNIKFEEPAPTNKRKSIHRNAKDNRRLHKPKHNKVDEENKGNNDNRRKKRPRDQRRKSGTRHRQRNRPAQQSERRHGHFGKMREISGMFEQMKVQPTDDNNKENGTDEIIMKERRMEDNEATSSDYYEENDNDADTDYDTPYEEESTTNKNDSIDNSSNLSADLDNDNK